MNQYLRLIPQLLRLIDKGGTMLRKGIAIIIFVLSLVYPLIAYCAWLPVPSSTQELRRDRQELMGNDIIVTIYQSDLSFDEIAEFYKERLGASGWQEITADKTITKDLSRGAFSKLSIFQKDDNMITISYLPTSEIVGKTRYSLTQGKFSFPEDAGEKEKIKLEEYGNTKGIPAYPNATLVPFASAKTFSGRQWAYNTSDTPESVLGFYREKMSAYGWELDQQIPITKDSYNPQDLEKVPQYKELKAELSSSMQNRLSNTSMRLGSLKFRKNNEVCIIAVTEITSLSGINTQISILSSKER